MKIAVYGAGAVGSFYGALLARAGLDVRFVTLEAQLHFDEVHDLTAGGGGDRDTASAAVGHDVDDMIARRELEARGDVPRSSPSIATLTPGGFVFTTSLPVVGAGAAGARK